MTHPLRLAFSKQFANQLWQGDTMFGPFVSDQDKKRQAFLIAFIDDASRVVTHGEFFFKENIAALINVFKTAFYKRGIPEVIYVDNGAIYTCKEIILVCARLGVILQHAPLADGAAKGKIERFFHTVRSSFLCHQLDLSSLASLNRQFLAWLEEEYNSKPHSIIEMRPIDRFNLDYQRIRFLPPNEANEELFFFQEDRTVKKDNTFS
ncbi:MAG: transposase, partial [Chlamydiae bacterium]|nr:transposase [Chlamydiota bacterium]